MLLHCSRHPPYLGSRPWRLFWRVQKRDYRKFKLTTHGSLLLLSSRPHGRIKDFAIYRTYIEYHYV